MLQEFTFGDKGSNQRCSYSQKRKNTLNYSYLETTTKQLVSVRKLHKHRRSTLSSFFETQILLPLRHRLPRWGFKSCDITTNTQIISIEKDYLMHKKFKNIPWSQRFFLIFLREIDQQQAANRRQRVAKATRRERKTSGYLGLESHFHADDRVRI